MSVWRVSRWALVLGLLQACSFAADSESLEGLPCSADGQCLEGFFCDLSTNTCEIAICESSDIGTVQNCEFCGQDCGQIIENASPVCVSRAGSFLCSFDGECDEGAFDLNLDPADGCECLSGAEVACDGLDQDCDGADLIETDTVDNCGGCGNDCSGFVVGAANPLCVSEQCSYDACLNGEVDSDGDRSNGCECSLSNSGVETCDNVDNNCNGTVDDGLLGCQCTNASPTAELCDGVDNDCNGVVDDGAGFECVFGDIVSCDGGTGTRRCSGQCVFGACIPSDASPPSPVADFTALGGDGVVTLRWTYPPEDDLGQCTIRRDVGPIAPATRFDGTEVAVIAAVTPGAPAELSDTDVLNGTEYSYRIFCRDSSGNFSGEGAPGNFATATPLDPLPPQVTNFTAFSGTNNAVPFLFTVPSGVDECRLLRRTGGFPIGHDDLAATQVQSFTMPGLNSGNDSPLTNDVEYFYAVFCRDGARWNDAVTEGDNAARAIPSDGPVCPSSTTMTIVEHSVDQCGDLSAGGLVGFYFFRFETDCDNALESLTLNIHPASNARDNSVSEILLIRDVDKDGFLGAADEVLATETIRFGEVTFDGFSDEILASDDAEYIVAGRAPDVIPQPLFVAFELDNSASVELAGGLQTIAFEEPTPVPSRMMVFTQNDRICDSGVVDPGDGSLGPIRASILQSTTDWNDGAGDELDWSLVNGQARRLANCSVEDPENLISDDGASSRVLRLDTPIPVGLPVQSCELDFRLYSTSWSGGTDCDHESLSGMKTARVFPYVSLTSVLEKPVTVNLEDAVEGPEAAGECPSEYETGNIMEAYLNSSSPTFSIRVVLEEGNDPAGSSDKRTRVTETFLRFR